MVLTWVTLRRVIDFIQYSLGDNELREIIDKKEFLIGSSGLFDKDLEYIAYYKSWFWVILKNYPLLVTKKTLNQLYIVLFNIDYYYLTHAELYEAENYCDSHYKYRDYLVQTLNFKSQNIRLKFPFLLAASFYGLSFVVRLLFILAFTYATYKNVIKKEFYFLQIMLAFLIMGSIGLIALTHTFDITRYMQSLTPFIYLFCYLFILKILEYLNSRFLKKV